MKFNFFNNNKKHPNTVSVQTDKMLEDARILKLTEKVLEMENNIEEKRKIIFKQQCELVKNRKKCEKIIYVFCTLTIICSSLILKGIKN